MFAKADCAGTSKRNGGGGHKWDLGAVTESDSRSEVVSAKH